MEYKTFVIGFRKPSGEDMKYLCWFENTDINGQFSLNFLNRGSLVLTGHSSFELKLKIQAYLEHKLEAQNVKV